MIFSLNILFYKWAKYLKERNEQLWTPQVEETMLGIELRTLNVHLLTFSLTYTGVE